MEFKPENGKKQKKPRMIFIDLQLNSSKPGEANFYMLLFLMKVHFVLSKFVGYIALVP